jgi:uncharacterized protein YceK
MPVSRAVLVSRAIPSLVAAMCMLTAGCMTLDTRTNPSYSGPPVYSGTRVAAGYAGQTFYALNIPYFAFFTLDTALSLVADTVLLPFTIPEQIRWSERRQTEARTDIEQPSVILPPNQEAPEDTARRLFRACEPLARTLNNTYLDCYSANAKIEIVDEGEVVRTLTGTEYKEEIRPVMDAARGGTKFVRYADPTFERDGENVRITATRLDSELDGRTPIELIVGAGPDGGWRILEERSIGWQ